MLILALDPSGNFYEGKGITGYCIAEDDYIKEAGQICAEKYNSQQKYWTAVINLIRTQNTQHKKLTVVCEDYRLYASKCESQINSNLETPQLIGAIKWYCYINNIKLHMQMASEVKTRWSNEILLHDNIIRWDSKIKRYVKGNVMFEHHSMDALRHYVHYYTFKDKPKSQTENEERSYDNYD